MATKSRPQSLNYYDLIMIKQSYCFIQNLRKDHPEHTKELVKAENALRKVFDPDNTFGIKL